MSQSETRVLGVDYGERRVGLALSDPTGLIAQPLATLTVASLADAVEQVAAAAKREHVRLIVVGYPLQLSGEPGRLARRVDRFVGALEEAGALPVVKWDERLSTVQAARILRGVARGRRAPKGREDRIAASLLLAAFLERERGAGHGGV